MGQVVRVAVLVAVVLALAGLGRLSSGEPAQDMADAAGAFLGSLTPEQRERAALPFEDALREDWHYVPRERAGIEFGEMTDAQRRAARALLRSALSSRGMHKVEEIMLLDAVLRDLEQGRGPQRDPLAYAIAVFGTPGDGVWGWKLEGHHISLNFTGVDGALAVTPSFLGANPGEVREGDRAGVRVLAWEEDLGYALLESLTDAQRAVAIVGREAPRDILASPQRSLDVIDGSGLEVSAMDAGQRAIVEALLEEYAGTLRADVAELELARIREAGLERVRFAWIGSEERGQGHYYRLAGPTFVIELDNVESRANHIHTVWRDRERDFGRDLLREHHEHGHGPR